MGRVVGPPAGRDDDRLHPELDEAGYLIEIDASAGLGIRELGALRLAQLLTIENVKRRKRHVVGKTKRTDSIHTQIEVVRDPCLDRLEVLLCEPLTLREVPRMDPDRHIVRASPTRDVHDLREGVDPDPRVLADAPEVHLQPAGRRTQLRKVAVRAQNTAAEKRLPLEQDYVQTHLCQFDGGRDPGDAAADDEDRILLPYRRCVRHLFLSRAPHVPPRGPLRMWEVEVASI